MPTYSIQALNDVLCAAKTGWQQSRSCQVILGNEASDLDSMASSIAYAWLLADDCASKQETALPVMNIPRDDFKLRTEAVYLFGEVGIEVANLMFLDEINLDDLRNQQQLKLVLIDHNKLAPSQEALADVVDEIIDHHKDSKLYPHVTKRTIEPVGSTATLIADRIIERKRAIDDKGLAMLLLGTILLDTVKLSPNRTTARDEGVVRKLLEVVDAAKDALFEKLQAEKFKTEDLSTYDLLRKDFKQWQAGRTRYGISSVPISVGDWLAKDDDLEGGFRDYAESRKLDVLLTMHFYEDTEFRRELGVFSQEQASSERRIGAMVASDLQLEPIAPTGQQVDESGHLSFFKQQNTKISRKKLQPVLNDLFAG